MLHKNVDRDASLAADQVPAALPCPMQHSRRDMLIELVEETTSLRQSVDRDASSTATQIPTAFPHSMHHSKKDVDGLLVDERDCRL